MFGVSSLLIHYTRCILGKNIAWLSCVCVSCRESQYVYAILPRFKLARYLFLCGTSGYQLKRLRFIVVSLHAWTTEHYARGDTKRKRRLFTDSSTFHTNQVTHQLRYWKYLVGILRSLTNVAHTAPPSKSVHPECTGSNERPNMKHQTPIDQSNLFELGKYLV